MNPIELGKFIANLRNEKHLTQEDLADKLYIDKRKISRWECGTSVPEFDMLIKLSEILDVSLYELSICKRIKNEKINRRILNKFKSIKDIRKYNTKKKIVYSLILLLFLFFTLTTIYTFKYYGTVEIYELDSLDEKYSIRGNYIRINSHHLLNINRMELKEKYHNKNSPNLSKCNYEVYDKNFRLFSITYDEKKESGSLISNYTDEMKNNRKVNSILTIKIICKNKEDYSFNIKLKNIYNNKLF